MTDGIYSASAPVAPLSTYKPNVVLVYLRWIGIALMILWPVGWLVYFDVLLADPDGFGGAMFSIVMHFSWTPVLPLALLAGGAVIVAKVKKHTKVSNIANAVLFVVSLLPPLLYFFVFIFMFWVRTTMDF